MPKFSLYWHSLLLCRFSMWFVWFFPVIVDLYCCCCSHVAELNGFEVRIVFSTSFSLQKNHREANIRKQSPSVDRITRYLFWQSYLPLIVLFFLPLITTAPFIHITWKIYIATPHVTWCHQISKRLQWSTLRQLCLIAPLSLINFRALICLACSISGFSHV